MTHPIAAYRKQNQLTLEAFGALVGATKGMVSKWEAGKVLPRAHFMSRISAISNGAVSADGLLKAFSETASSELPSSEAAE